MLQPEVLDAVYRRTAEKVKAQFAHVPEQLRLKKIELNRAETRVHNFIEFIASGRATPSLADALTPMKPDIGKPYDQASCKVDALNLLACGVRAEVRVYCDGGAAGNRTRVREVSGLPSFTCVVALTLATGFVDSATT